MKRRALLLVLLIVGCSPPTYFPPTPAEADKTPTENSTFGPTQTVSGRVIWQGAEPVLQEFPAVRMVNGKAVTETLANPNHPIVDAQNFGIKNTVIELRGVNPTNAPSLNLLSPHLIFNGRTIATKDGARIALAKQGDTLTIQSTSETLAVIRGRGAAFFSWQYPKPNTSRSMVLNKPGKVLLTTGSGEFTSRAEVFVIDHPYWAITDADGKFTLPNVPSGQYELICHIRPWIPLGWERDPESGLIARLNFGPDIQMKQTITVTPTSPLEVTMTFNPATRGGQTK